MWMKSESVTIQVKAIELTSIRNADIIFAQGDFNFWVFRLDKFSSLTIQIWEQ